MSQVEWQVTAHAAVIRRTGVRSLEAAEAIADAEQARLVITSGPKKIKARVSRTRMFCVSAASVALGGMLGVGTYAYAQPGLDTDTPRVSVVADLHQKRRAPLPKPVRHEKISLDVA